MKIKPAESKESTPKRVAAQCGFPPFFPSYSRAGYAWVAAGGHRRREGVQQHRERQHLCRASAGCGRQPDLELELLAEPAVSFFRGWNSVRHHRYAVFSEIVFLRLHKIFSLFI